jgi:hypothetical protein
VNLRLQALSAATLLAAGCSDKAKSGPWLSMPNASTHAVNFPIAAGDTHGPGVGQATANCNGCHWDRAAVPPGPSATFKVFSCTHCHVLLRSGVYHDDPQATFSAWHVAAGVGTFDATVAAANVVGVAPLDAACRACHPSGIGVDHAARFILPHQDAAATIVATCGDCHLDQANRAVLGCAQCHPHDLAATATGHAQVPDFSATSSTLCARCHEDGKVPVAVSAHALGAGGFTVGAGVHSGAAGGACLTCHPQNRTTPLRTFVADFSVTTCVACHVTVGGAAFHDDVASLTTLHAPVATFTGTVTTLGLSAACLSCHPDGGATAPANHEQVFPRGPGTAHAALGCFQCHGSAVKTDLAALGCASCHLAMDPALAAKHGTVGGVAILVVHTSRTALGPPLTMTSPNCIRCHADSQVFRVSSHSVQEGGFSRSQHSGAGCVTCHSGNRVDKPYPATSWGLRPGCVICHTSGVP